MSCSTTKSSGQNNSNMYVTLNCSQEITLKSEQKNSFGKENGQNCLLGCRPPVATPNCGAPQLVASEVAATGSAEKTMYCDVVCVAVVW